MIKETDEDIEEIMSSNGEFAVIKDKKPVVTNHSGYNYEGSENYEHDDNGSIMNYSGCVDEVYDAISVHEDWQEDYDY